MRMRFNETKVTQAAAVMLKLRGGRMKYIKLLKLLYLADRKSLLERGRPITTDRYVSMDDGPVLSKTYNLIQGDYRETEHVWSSTIVPAADYDVQLKDLDADLQVGQLSQAELGILKSVFGQYGHWNRWKLIDKVMHKLPEWHNPNGSMIPIEVRDILQTSALSLSEQMAIERGIRKPHGRPEPSGSSIEMKKGDCVHMRTPGNPISHLWIIVSDIDPTTDQCVIVNVTTLGHICDKTVILHDGDHPCIDHDSVVRYQDATIVTSNNIQAAIRGKAAFTKPPCSRALLARIIEGIGKSSETPFDIQKFCGFQVPTEIPVEPKKKPK